MAMPADTNTTLWNRILLVFPPCWEVELGTLTKNFFQSPTQELTWDPIQKTFLTPLGNHEDP